MDNKEILGQRTTNPHDIIVDNLGVQKNYARARLVRKNLNLSLLETILIGGKKDIKHMNVDLRLVLHLLHIDLMDISITIESMDIEIMNVDPKKNLFGQPRSKEIHLRKVTLIIEVTKHGIIFIIVVNMVMV